MANKGTTKSPLTVVGGKASDEPKKAKHTVASLSKEVSAMSESMAEIDSKIDALQSSVSRLDALTRGLAIEPGEGELSRVAVSTLYKDVDVLKTLTKMLVERIKKNNNRVQKITDEADRLKAKYPRFF